MSTSSCEGSRLSVRARSTRTLAISGASTSPCLLSANDDSVSMRQNSMLWPSPCPSCSDCAAARCGAPGDDAKDLLGALEEALAADEQPHDSDASCAARLEPLDALLQARRIGHAERNFDVVLVFERLDGREHFLVPLLRAAVRHHEHAEVVVAALRRRRRRSAACEHARRCKRGHESVENVSVILEPHRKRNAGVAARLAVGVDRGRRG